MDRCVGKANRQCHFLGNGSFGAIPAQKNLAGLLKVGRCEAGAELLERRESRDIFPAPLSRQTRREPIVEVWVSAGCVTANEEIYELSR